MQELTAAHWVFLIGVVVILITMLARKNIIVPAVGFTFLTAWVFTQSFASGLAAVFNASLVAAQELFTIFLIIALVTGMLGALQALGADKKMVTPFRPVMRNGHLAFWTLVVVTYIISLFFWPTPAVPLIGAVLIPVAIRAGLRPMAVAFTIAVAGQGMALSSDFVIRVAPGLSATAAGVDPDAVANRAMTLSLIVGGTALIIGYLMEFRRMRKPSQRWLDEWDTENVEAEREEAEVLATAPTIGHGPALLELEHAHVSDAYHHDGDAVGGSGSGSSGGSAGQGPISLRGDDGPIEVQNDAPAWAGSLFAIAVPLAYFALIAYMIYSVTQEGTGGGLKGGDAAALVGGIAALTIFAAAFAESRKTFLERSAQHVVDGLVFAFKAMGVVIPIAGFFFLGNGDFAGRIMGVPVADDGTSTAPAFLYDLVLNGQAYIPQNAFITAFGILVIGMIAGLEGSGFAGLPLTGSLAGTFGSVTGVDAATLAAVGQMGNIWSGGGTLVAWSSLIAVAGFARVPVLELARKSFVPVVSGLILATIFAVLIL